MGKHSQLYRDVLDSPRWQGLRERLIAQRENTCAGCAVPKPARDLQLHHTTYDRLGEELDTDLEVLCQTCHRDADRKRANHTHQRRLEGWVYARYGEDGVDDWDDADWDEANGEFLAWLRGKHHDGRVARYSEADDD